MKRFLLLACALGALSATCEERQPAIPTTQGLIEEVLRRTDQEVDRAWQRSDQAAEQVATARDDVRHAHRLRDIDRLRHDEDVSEVQAQATTLRGMTVGLTFALLAALVWLAIEVRRRRIATRALMLTVEMTGGDACSEE